MGSAVFNARGLGDCRSQGVCMNAGRSERPPVTSDETTTTQAAAAAAEAMAWEKCILPLNLTNKETSGVSLQQKNLKLKQNGVAYTSVLYDPRRD